MAKQSWFEVDRDGLRALIAGKPKSLILRELLQNAWDEPGVTEVTVTTQQGKGVASIQVIDDAPEGFCDLRHAYTLFADTRKRANPEQRGRFNLGEKEVLSLCTEGSIVTTKGGVKFCRDGTRKNLRVKRTEGSEIHIKLRMNQAEYKKMLVEVQTYILPAGIKTIINGEILKPKFPVEIIEAKLLTEILKDGILRRTIRKTTISIYQTNGKPAMLYEMGLPICETGDAYHYNVAQKVPLGTDRETVSASYLRTIRAEVANIMAEEVPEEEASAGWLRDAMSSDKVEPETVRQLIEKRFGDRIAVASPTDSQSVDRAIEHGYRIVRPSELSKEEWENVRAAEAIPSTHSLFPTNFIPAEIVLESEWTEDQKKTVEFAKWLADKLLEIEISVEIFKSRKVSNTADYSRDHKLLRFNAARINAYSWQHPSAPEMLELLVHELGHEGGGHYDAGYHQKLCKMAAKLPGLTLKHPDKFKT